MLLRVVLVGLAGLLGYWALIFALQRQMVFPVAGEPPGRPAASGPTEGAQVWLGLSFGSVEAWFFEAPGDRAPTLIFAHGNGELIDHWGADMQRLTARGISTFLVEFPGYGHSEGSPSRNSIREAVAGAYDWLVGKGGVDATRIVAWGRSLGGGAASDLSRDRPIRALILQSTFSSTAEMAHALFAPGFLVRDKFDNRRAVSEFAGPVLLMHGVRDDVIPFRHAERVAHARPGLDVTRLECAHNDCGRVWPDIVTNIEEFLRANGLLDRS